MTPAQNAAQWRMVPVEPTPEMIEAAVLSGAFVMPDVWYRAMLAAAPAPALARAGGDGWRDTVMFVAKWVERGLFDKNVSAKDALEVIAHYPGMPFKTGRWDIDHKDYAKAFYAAFPKAAAPDAEGRHE